ncbi:hypothetical protein SRABI118_01986 [Massilia sp. Bi118]|uniref:hypothetical protein n=1 Tax=Massilia sp. Bi118 TaxID=2822346 RepID=UPI001D90CC0E|nr:hypothetical protein [Massilia sp. Bi118]CAH0211138.1 hypothetical protein SRABI118_01986 [Massilia sp. Bi118]
MPSSTAKNAGKTTGAKKRKSAKFKVDRTDGVVKLEGRGRFIGSGKKLKVAKTEDRRHLLHLSEQLKPVLSRVFTALEREHKGDKSKALAVVLNHLRKRNFKRLPKTLDQAIIRVADEVNSSSMNLVPDDAGINKAIEHLRADLRVYLTEAAKATAGVYLDDTGTLLGTEMARLRALADKSFAAKNEGTPIQNARDVMTASVRELIKAQQSPAEVHALVMDLTYSVTFDLSSKARREQTALVLKWQRDMAAAESWPAEQQLDCMLGIIQ